MKRTMKLIRLLSSVGLLGVSTGNGIEERSPGARLHATEEYYTSSSYQDNINANEASKRVIVVSTALVSGDQLVVPPLPRDLLD